MTSFRRTALMCLACVLPAMVVLHSDGKPAQARGYASSAAAKLSKKRILTMVTRDGWSESRLLTSLARHFEHGGQPFRFSLSEIQRLKLAGVSEDTLDLLVNGVSTARGKALLKARMSASTTQDDRVRRTTQQTRQQLGSVCAVGMIAGCDSQCVRADRLNDGSCDGALNCEKHDYDDGDCASGSQKLRGTLVTVTTTLPGLGDAPSQPELGFSVGYVAWSDLHVGGDMLITVLDGAATSLAAAPEEVRVTFMGRAGWFIELEDSRTSLIDLQLGLGVEIADQANFVLALGPGLVLAFGEAWGGFVRLGVDLQLAFVSSPVLEAGCVSPTPEIRAMNRSGLANFNICGDESEVSVRYMVAPTLGFGGHF